MNCQVSGCPNESEWECVESSMLYCTTHKHPHGEPPHKFRRAKARRSNAKRVPIAATLT